jgi:DNA-binding HxlR family transcriptional regulator
VNQQIRNIADLDRVIHEPGRLMIVALLFAVDRADFLYLQHETAMNKGTLSSRLSRLEEAGYVAVTKTLLHHHRRPRHHWSALRGQALRRERCARQASNRFSTIEPCLKVIQ